VKFTVEKLVRLAYRRAGLLELTQTLTQPQLAAGVELLETILHEMPTYGFFARMEAFHELVLTEGVYRYLLPNTVLDVAEGALIAPDQEVDRAAGETRVSLISKAQWHALSAKSALGHPTLFFPDRVADIIEVFLWPIPHQTGATIRFLVQRQLSDDLVTTSAIDLETSWDGWVIERLAADLAGASSLDTKAMTLSASAQEKLVRAIGFANDHAPRQLVRDHDTGLGW
jgi:hypothetical protein